MSKASSHSLLDRTVRKARSAWQRIAGGEYDADTASLRPGLPDEDMDRVRQQMQECLEQKGGEVSARAKAAALGRVYMALDPGGQAKFLDILNRNFCVDHDAIRECASRLAETGEEGKGGDSAALEAQLRTLLTAPRIKLLTQFNALPEGVKFLVDLRSDLLKLLKTDTALKGLDDDLKSLLSGWFDVGFLELRRITWENASASLLEKLIAYEAVHAINDWNDLKNRLESDRRCFAFFHPRMPEEPLIFVEVALVSGLAGNVQDLLDPDAPVIDPASADTAIFYSISNAQKGLSGISFGNFLIKRVVEELSLEFPHIKTFATLSPIPGFRAWLDKALKEEGEGLLSDSERDAVQKDDLTDALKAPLTRLCVRYLTQEKRRETKALDPVAHFHLTNGARMERLNWMGDTSEKGIEQSCGMMINYLYKMDRIEGNHEAYSSDGTIAASSSIRGLMKN